MEKQIDIFVSSLNAFWQQIANFVPKMVAAILLLLIGWLIARLVRGGVRRLLAISQFKSLVHNSGVEDLLRHGGITVTFTGMIAELSFWFVMLVVIVMVSNSLGLTVVADLFNRIVLYLPNVIVAILVLIFGSLLGRFINRLMFAWLNNLGVANALILSTATQYSVYVLTLFLALQQLNIGAQLLTAAFVILFGGICLALALAFGLGGRDWAASVIERAARAKDH
jgi:hypothetical protein